MGDNNITIAAQEGRQYEFLATSADVAFYGGAAGGGKSFALLLEPLRHIQAIKGFGAVIFRRESPQITNEGGLWDEAENLYLPFGAKDRQSPKLQWAFPPYSNAVTFSHMQHEKDRHAWQGSQVPLICFDELTHFTRSQFFYMLSRNRSTCGVEPYIRATYNPVPEDDEIGGWIHEFVGWYLDENGEYPDPEKAGVIRWFINMGDTLHWFDSQEDALAEFPDIPPKSFTFIPASVFDNKILLETNPQYLANLHALNEIDRERLLHANHKIKASAGKVFSREWFPIVDSLPLPVVDSVRFWDFAATEKKRKKGAATASVKMGKMSDGRYIILDVTEDFIGPSEVDNFAAAVARQDGRAVKQRWEEEGGSSGKRTTSSLAVLMSGLDCWGVRPTGDKLDRSRPLSAQARAGNVLLLRASWNERFLSHMHNVPDGRFDIHDSAAGSFNELNGVVIQYGASPLDNYRG